MTKTEMLLEYVIRPIVASGRTRLLVTLTAIMSLSLGIYKDPTHGIYYGGGVVFALALFIISKTYTDARCTRTADGQPGEQSGDAKPDPV